MTKSTQPRSKHSASERLIVGICVSNSKIPCLLGVPAPKKRYKSIVYDRNLSKKMRKGLSEVEKAYADMASNLRTCAVELPTVLIPSVTEYLALRKAAQNERKRRTVPVQAP